MTARVRSHDVELAYEVHGDPQKPTVVLVHGFPDDRRIWSGVIEHLVHDHHVVAYDVRGAGESTAAPSPEGYRLEQLAADLVAVIGAAVPGKRVHLVGHDWGSIASWESVGTDNLGERLASYTSISGPCLDHVGYWLREQATRASTAFARQLVKSWYVGMFHLPFVGPLMWRAGLGKQWSAFAKRVEGVTTPAGDRTEDAVRGIQLYRANMRQRLTSPRVRKTNVPVQLIVPTHDHYVGPDIAGTVAPWAPTLWRREAVAPHWLPLADPALTARWIGEFVAFVETGRGTPDLERARVRSDIGPHKLAVVTGAGAGIGRATALALADRGFDLVAADLDADGARITCELVELVGGRAFARQVDVASEADMERLAEYVFREHGTPDVVVNNAGIGIAGPFLSTTRAEWDRVLDVNLNGVAHGCRLFAKQMVAERRAGHIVNVASAAAFSPSRVLPAYATSKAAVLMLSECLRAELAAHDIGVTAICPGVIDTGITSSTRFAGESNEAQARRRRRAAQLYRRRGLTADHVAETIVDAIEHDRPVAPVGAEAYGLQWLGRFAPALARRIAKLELA